MTVKISGVPFDQIVPEIQEALDTALGGHVKPAAGQLG